MGFSPLANMAKRIPHGNRYSTRTDTIKGFTIHHHSGVNAQSEATNPAREVSANYWISNEGEILPHIDEDFRAWTTGAPGYPAGAESDHRNITVEVSNSHEGVRSGSYAISDLAMTALIKLIADVFARHNLGKVRRGTSSGVAVHQDFVATACPGPYIMANLNKIIAGAEKLRKPVKPVGGKKIMKQSSHTLKKPLKVGAGKHKRMPLNTKLGLTIPAKGDAYFTGGIYAKGAKGEPVEALIFRDTWDTKLKKTVKSSVIRRQAATIGSNGLLRVQVSGVLPKRANERYRLALQNKTTKTVTVTRVTVDLIEG